MVSIQIELQKEKLWQEIADRASRITDKLGMPIDQGILDTVIVLNALDITTKQSCEGHVDRAVCAPWIFFTTPGIDELNKQVSQAQEQAMQASKERKHTHAELIKLFEPSHQLRHQADSKHAEDQQKVLAFLDAFYANRHAPQDKRLIVYSRSPGTSTLESQGARCQSIDSPEARAQKLKEYQEEMQAFTAFLKAIFFYGGHPS
jgi:hypothetical protein